MSLSGHFDPGCLPVLRLPLHRARKLARRFGAPISAPNAGRGVGGPLYEALAGFQEVSNEFLHVLRLGRRKPTGREPVFADSATFKHCGVRYFPRPANVVESSRRQRGDETMRKPPRLAMIVLGIVGILLLGIAGWWVGG